MLDLAILNAEAAAGMYKRPVELLAKEIHYELLPSDVWAVIVAARTRGGMLPRAMIENMVTQRVQLSSYNARCYMTDASENRLTGATFLRGITGAEDACAKVTIERLPHLGEKLTVCNEALGMTLALIDCAAACWWGCSRGDHRIEFLIGRAANSAYAALSLAKRGYYDQALSGARTLGEIANLMALFVSDPPQLERWKALEEGKRRSAFSATPVRKALEKLGVPIPVRKERYGMLSGFSIHADPNTMSQAHNPLGRAVTSPVYQEAGLFMAINEIALPIAFVAVYARILLNYPADRAKIFKDTATALIENFGGINVMQKGRPWFKLHY